MASAYDEIKKALVMLRQREPITEQRHAELKRVRSLLEEKVAMAELLRSDLPPCVLEFRANANDPLAARKSSES
jgi:hypothetical protein